MIDRASLLNVAPQNAQAYLVSQGWADTKQIADKGAVFAKTDENQRQWEILLPLRTNLADYAECMAEAIAVLATVEQRSELAVHSDIADAHPND